MDNSIGYNYLEKMVEIIKKYKLKNIINVLTHSKYKADKIFINNLQKQGFEIS